MKLTSGIKVMPMITRATMASISVKPAMCERAIVCLFRRDCLAERRRDHVGIDLFADQQLECAAGAKAGAVIVDRLVDDEPPSGRERRRGIDRIERRQMLAHLG